jgi:hypothetical protein
MQDDADKYVVEKAAMKKEKNYRCETSRVRTWHNKTDWCQTAVKAGHY